MANQAPVLSGVAATAAYTESAAPVTLSPAVTVSDVDNAGLVSATVRITGGIFAGDGDVLAANVSGTLITASYNAANETLLLSGSDTLAHYQQVLRTVTFSSTSNNPTNAGGDTTRSIEWQVNDGSILSGPWFQPKSEYIAGNSPSTVATADLNGDGTLDIVAA